MNQCVYSAFPTSKIKSRNHVSTLTIFVYLWIQYAIQCGWASGNEVGPVDLKRLLACGPVPKFPNVTAYSEIHFTLLFSILPITPVSYHYL